MIKRCVEIGTGPTHLRVRDRQLVLKREGDELAQIPLEDLGVLVIDHAAVTYTHTALTELLAHNVAVIFCGADHHPVGQLLPADGHTLQSETATLQARASSATSRRLWKQLVRAKILNQAALLEHLGTEAGALRALAAGVRSGDSTNREAAAAQRYWKLLFSPGFRRRRGGPPPNNLLNYGYMALRAAVARALVGAGLHPSLGVAHTNRYNPFCLADDLMEPLRPVVDERVYRLWSGGVTGLERETRRALLELLSQSVLWQGERSPLLVATHRFAAAFREALAGKAELSTPAPIFEAAGP